MQTTASPTPDANITLPHIEPQLTAAARQLTAHARPVLAASHAWLLSLTVSTRTPGAPVAMGWTDMGQPIGLRPLLADKARLVQESLAEFEVAGERLLAHLAQRWPVNAVPPAIGVVTDGEGVFFSSDYPSPLHPDWLALHQAGLCVPAMVLAFPIGGNWAQLMEYGRNRSAQLNIYH